MDIDTLINSYVSVICRIVKDGLAIDDFYGALSEGLKRELQYNQTDFLHLHHAFHWALFCDGDPPFRYVQGRGNGEKSWIEVRRPITKVELSRVVKERYGGYLQERINNLPRRV